jgi:hypothetical protein
MCSVLRAVKMLKITLRCGRDGVETRRNDRRKRGVRMWVIVQYSRTLGLGEGADEGIRIPFTIWARMPPYMIISKRYANIERKRKAVPSMYRPCPS